MFGMNDADPDEAEPIDNWQIIVGDITYTAAIFPSDGQFVGSWRCPVCQQRQGCSWRTNTYMEAADCADVEVRAHHDKFHRKPFPVGPSSF